MSLLRGSPKKKPRAGTLVKVLGKAKIVKLPTPTKGGNPKANRTRAAQTEILDELISGSAQDVEDGVDILPVYNEYNKFKRECAAYEEHPDDEDIWPELSTLRGIDETWLTASVDKHSGMSVDELLVVNQDGDSLQRMVHGATQVSPKCILPVGLRRKTIMSKFLDARVEDCGSRLKQFKARGGFDAARGKLVWDDAGSYAFVTTPTGKLVAFIHRAADHEVTLPDDSGLQAGLKVDDAWDDFQASIVHPLFGKLPISKFFEATAERAACGPWHVSSFIGKNHKSLDIAVAASAERHDQALRALRSGGSAVSSDVSAQIQQKTQEKNQLTTAAAREAAQAKVRARKEAASSVVKLTRFD